MSDHDMGFSKINTETYESAWLGRWTRLGSEVKLESHSNLNAKCPKEINLPEDGQLLKESKGSMKLKGKMLSGFLHLFPNLDFRSNDKEAHEAKSESSAEQTDKAKRIRLAGTISSKGLRILDGAERVELIPDMNKEPLIVVDRENSIDGEDGETSSSANQGMNVELKECKRIRLDSESSCRSQVKRLKTNASDYTINETKSMIVVEEGPSGTKGNNFFHRILKSGTNKPGSRRNQPSASQIKNLNMGGGEEDVAALQHPWIQRWCKKKDAASNELGGQQVNPKGITLEKQFPSIAAMALMGKALSGLNPTSLRKSNSLFVWKAQNLR